MITELVLAEIHDAPRADAAQILGHLERVKPGVFALTEEMKTLANAYIAAGVLPASRQEDAVHVAAATCLALAFLVSWNHRHMTRPMKRLQFESVNRLNGYLETPMICNPFEACNEIGN